MLILLPPSEGKSAADSGPVLDLGRLSFPELQSTRTTVLRALQRMCAGDLDEAVAALGLGPTQHGEVRANARLGKEPCAPAIEVYTGVLYEALDAGSLSTAARRRLDEQVAIASALWGLVRPGDPIPSYRLSGSVTLPGVGPLASAWRPDISALLAATPGLLIDMRSGSYVSLGPMPDSASDRAVTVRVLNDRNGKRSVVSHNNKATKGRLVRSLVSGRRRPRDVHSLVEALDAEGFEVEVSRPRPDQPTVLDVILR